MRLSPQRWIAGVLSFALLTLVLTGCGGVPHNEDDDEDIAPTKKAKKKSATATVVSLKPVKATEYGVIRGKVAWEGPEPSFAEETANLRKNISGNPDKDYCLTGKMPGGKESKLLACETEQKGYRLGKNKLLGNVFVWIQPEAGHFFEIPKDQLEPFAKSVVTLSQPHCAFLPHCLVLFTYHRGQDGKLVPTGQKFFIENNARVGHNANVKGGGPNIPQGSSIESMKEGEPAKSIEIMLKPDPTPVQIACNIHGWMTAWAKVFDHPYATLSSVGADLKAKVYEDLDNPNVGTYEIKGVPVGAKVKVFAWHEELGFLGDPKGEVIELKKENVKDFTAKGK